MLLEAWRIAQALKAAGIEAEPRSADVKSPGKTGGPVLRLLIGADLTSEIVPVPDDELETLWAFRQGNFHYWPVVRPAGPICRDRSRALQWRSSLSQASKLPQAARPAAMETVRANGVSEACTIRLPKDISEVAGAHRDAACQVCCACLCTLIDTEATARTKHNSKFRSRAKLPRDVRILRWRVRCFLRKQPTLASATPGAQKAIFAVLYGKGLTADGKGDGQIAFDLKERSIYTSHTRQAVETALQAGSDGPGGDHVCEISGEFGVRHTGKFPNPALPVVAAASIPMFSMFRDAHANFRYGLADASIVSLNRETVNAAHDALVFVTSKEHRGIFWRSFPNGKIKESQEQADLLIAYALGVEIARLYGDDEEDEPDGPTYEETTRPILQALAGEARLKPRATALLILLRQISNAQVQAVYCRAPTANEVFIGGNRWVAAQKELPPLICSDGPVRPISPAQVVRLLSKQWTGSPPSSRRLNGPSSSDVLDFMLSVGDDRAKRAVELLRQLLQRTSTLLKYVGTASRNRSDPDAKPKPDEQWRRAEADRLCRFIALVLNSKETSLEDTTRSPAYLLGLLLALVDTLHAAYCAQVRKATPTSLGGSQLLGTASDDPPRALGELLERIRPWRDWADTSQPKDDDLVTLRAKKALARMSKVAPHLAGRLPGGRLDDTGKAELLLGFLSRDAVADEYSSPTIETN